GTQLEIQDAFPRRSGAARSEVFEDAEKEVMDEPTYEELALIVKERDGWRCVNGCRPRGPVDKEGHPKLLRVVRKAPFEPLEPDSVDNLETICAHRGSKCLPDWEP